jgi:oligoendopeptidase F
LYEDHSTSTAETASTFFENLVFEDALKNVSSKQKMILLHNKITDDVSTIFRQIACFNFENELHETIRREGFLPKEKIAELMNKHMRSYLGPAVELTREDGYFFANWSHIRNFFYVYSYAFGQIISDALFERYKKDKNKIKDVIEFLSAGSSDSPENIFKKINLTVDKKLFETGLLRIKANVDELETLWKANK